MVKIINEHNSGIDKTQHAYIHTRGWESGTLLIYTIYTERLAISFNKIYIFRMPTWYQLPNYNIIFFQQLRKKKNKLKLNTSAD